MTTSWNRIAGRRIAVLGDLMLDEHVHGTATRLSPEAPVPVVQVTSRTLHPGGAANVAMNIAALSGEAELSGVTGEDEGAVLLRKHLPEAVRTTAILPVAARCTSRKTRVLADGYHHIVRFDEEVRGALDAAEQNSLWELLEPVVRNCEALVLSDYAKGVLTPSLCQQAIGLAKSLRIPVVVDPKDSDFTRYQGATVITPNYKEAVAAAAKVDSGSSGTEPEAIGATLLAAYQTPLILTLGGKGMLVLPGEGVPPVHIPARARRVFDVTGAGDTVVAVLAMALAAGFSLQEAAAMSTEAAGRVVQMPGTATVTLEELLRES